MSLTLSADETATLCAAGAMAPSGGNDQPWRVTVAGNTMRIGLDPRRSGKSFLDVGGYASLFAIGCFAENVGIAARSLGLGYERTADGTTVEFMFASRQAATADPLYEALPRRTTNRRLADGSQPGDEEVARLVSVVREADAACTVTALADPDRKHAVARALGAADVVRLRNRAMFSDMTREIRWTERETAATRDGIDLRTLELPGSTRVLMGLLRRQPWLRSLVPAGPLSATARSLVAGCARICCLSVSPELDASAMVRAGMALQRLWLTATAGGLAVHPWTVSTLEVIRLERFAGAGLSARERDAVARVAGGLRTAFGIPPGDTPVFVFRLSKAGPPSARSLRRPWESFTTVEAG